MPSLATPDLDALRQKIAALEKRPVLADSAIAMGQRLGSRVAANDARPRLAELLAAPAGMLHEVFADELQHSTAVLGFTLGLAQSLIRSDRQAIIYLQLAQDTQELGLPYAIGLRPFGIEPDKLIIGRVETLNELLWAMEEAIACRAVAGVIADIVGHPKALDFTVSRRLSLRASAAGTSAFLLRYGRGREASAAKLRWRVSPALSTEQAFNSMSPGPPRYHIEIEKKRLGNKLQRAENTRLVLDWTENGFVSAEPARVGVQPRQAPAASRPQPAALGDRLSQAG